MKYGMRIAHPQRGRHLLGHEVVPVERLLIHIPPKPSRILHPPPHRPHPNRLNRPSVKLGHLIYRQFWTHEMKQIGKRHESRQQRLESRSERPWCYLEVCGEGGSVHEDLFGHASPQHTPAPLSQHQYLCQNRAMFRLLRPLKERRGTTESCGITESRFRTKYSISCFGCGSGSRPADASQRVAADGVVGQLHSRHLATGEREQVSQRGPCIA